MSDATLERVGPENLSVCGIGCLGDRKHQGYQPKIEWLQERFGEGLRFLLFRDGDGKPLAFLEYVPGEYAWRPVDADGWLFVHCLWVYPRGKKIGGLGSRLIRACLDIARQEGAIGVAAMASDGPWMAGEGVFFKNGFAAVAQVDRFHLLANRIRRGRTPRFRDITGNAAKYRGLNIVYSAQCPMLVKSVNDLTDMARENGLEPKITVLEGAAEAQAAPSYYGVFSLIWNGKVLADHYVSKARFRNILRKEIIKDTG